ncbi:MAG TPA: ATP-binding protein, partial [Burkholderiales bacterium]|nr:ATP-binding protein [Burkholderiales bacterium]
IRDAQGVFRGTVFATVDLTHIETLFQSLQVGARASFALYRSDNYTQVLRWPPSPGKLNAPLPEDSAVRRAFARDVRTASIEMRSFSDGVTRIYALRKLDRYPFFISAGMSRDDIVEGWMKRALFVAIAALFVGSLLFWLLHRLWRAEGELLHFNVELEERVRARTAELENANRELEAFSYSISHDLRTPLRSISSYSRMVELDYAQCLDAQGRRMLQRVHEAAKKMGMLIEDLLRLSRVTRAHMKIEPVSLTELAEAISRELQRHEPQRNVTFSIQPDMTARADAGLLAVVLENLIGNAWKFTSTRESPHIEIGVVSTGTDTAYFVRDNGVGFDMAHVGNLFAPFHRLHGEREFPGTGIGLATVKRIIERHGGRVWADAAVDCGATFHFTLGRQDRDHG